MDGSEFFKTRIHGLPFSNLLCINRYAFLPSAFLRVILIFLCCLSIRLFCYVLMINIFCSKILWFLCHTVVGMCLRNLPQFAGRMFFRCFRMSCFVCIVLHCLSIFLVFPLSPVPSGLFTRVVLSVLLVLLFPFCLNIFLHFPLFCHCACCRTFLICVSSQISPVRFWVSVRVF